MTDVLDILPRHLRQIEAMLREHLPETVVWAYGSRVNGRSHPGSDLDLVLRSPTLEPIPAERIRALRKAFHDTTIPFLIEARDWAALPEGFRREIERRYVVISDEGRSATA